MEILAGKSGLFEQELRLISAIVSKWGRFQFLASKKFLAISTSNKVVLESSLPRLIKILKARNKGRFALAMTVRATVRKQRSNSVTIAPKRLKSLEN